MARGIGISLSDIASDRSRESLDLASKAADQEQRRNIQNQQIEQQDKAGKVQLGATVGAMYGSTFGPIGTMVGGAVGAIAGGLS